MKKAQVLWLIFGAVALLFLIGAATVQPGRPISQYPRVTTLQGTDIFPIARTNVVPATNMGSTWLVMTNDIFTLISNYVNTATNGFTSIPLGYQTNVWTTNINGTPVQGSDNISITNLASTTNWLFYGLQAETVARLGEIASATNLVLTITTNLVANSTNNFLAIVTNIANVASTNNVKVTAGTNIIVVTNVSGNTVTYQVNNGIDTNIFATTNFVSARLGTNFINLSVQAAKLPGNDNPAIGSGYKNWELVFYKTNVAGTISALSANWQFVVPPDYATNSLQLYMQQMILQTNGPATSNTIFCASIFKSTPGDSIDIHTNVTFNTEVCVTNTWSASTSGTNILQTSLFSFGANAPVQAGDFVVLNLKRNGTNDTYGWEAAVVGMQLLYARP